jgi:predicted dehydrogenase
VNKKTFRVGIAGSGFAAAFHYEALQRVFSARVELTGAYSPTAEKLQQFTATRNLTAFTSLEALIESCDVVHVCTPPITHEPIVTAALQRGRHVILEKPLTGYFGNGTETFNGDTFPGKKG